MANSPDTTALPVPEQESEDRLLFKANENIPLAACGTRVETSVEASVETPVDLEAGDGRPLTASKTAGVKRLFSVIPKVLMICALILVVILSILAGAGGEAAQILAVSRAVQSVVQVLALHANGTSETAATAG